MKIRPKTETPRENFINQLTKGPCTVVFTKVDGSVRRMPATLHHSLIPEKQIPDDALKPDTKVNEDTVVCFDLEKQAWRSFRVDSVISFEPALRVEV
jgi:hypothetical protein